MKQAFRAVALLTLSAPLAFADTQWSSPSSAAWTTAGNWTNGTPNSGPQPAYYVNSSAYQHHLQLSGTTVATIGFYFAAGSGSGGFNFDDGGVASMFNLRAGGTANGIYNADNNSQTISVPITLFAFNGIGGSTASQTWNAANSGLTFSGAYNGSSSTVSLNGGRLTIDGAFNTTIGSTTGRGDIVGNFSTSGLTKNGSGTLTLGGTNANTYIGSTILNSGVIALGKANAIGGSSQLLINAGTFRPLAFGGGQNQTNSNTTLNVQGGPGNVFIDFGNGLTNYVAFGNSSGVTWGAGSELDILNWNSANTNYLRFGTSASGLTAAQLAEIVYPDMPGAHAVIDSGGFVTPVPEPSAAVLSIVGGFGLAMGFFHRRKRF